MYHLLKSLQHQKKNNTANGEKTAYFQRTEKAIFTQQMLHVLTLLLRFSVKHLKNVYLFCLHFPIL